jgi:hypothetical protein
MKLLNTLKTILLKIRHLFPSALPQGGSEFDAWAKSIIDLYQPAADERSVKFALCAMLMRLNPTEAYKSKMFFNLCIRKGCAAQVAAYKMEEIKKQQAEEQEALKEQEALNKKQQEVASHGEEILPDSQV